MPVGEIRVPFPLGGLNKAAGYQSSDRQTTRSALNVVPDDAEESRTRGGSRPGLTKRYSTPLDASPLFLVRVSTGESTRVYEFLVAGTATNIFLGRSVPDGIVVPISYSENLNALSGDIATEADVTLLTEAGVELSIGTFDLQAIDRANVVAYQGLVVVGTSGTVLRSGSGTVSTSSLDDAAVANWTTIGIDSSIHWVDITSTDVNVASGTYRITAVSSGNLTLDRNPLLVGSGPINCTYVIRVGVRTIDPISPNISLLVPTGGFVPVNADAMCVYRDRIVWAIGRTWYMSRQGDPGDYDYGADPEDPARAIAGNASDAGQPADPIVAMASAGFDYLIIFAENSIWNMRGDPGFGGQLVNLSQTVGCVASKAWCYGDSTEIYFLSKDGLYFLGPNASGQPTPLSPEKLPKDLRGVDRDNNWVTLVYDPEDRGVLIFVVPKSGSAGNNWWFDIDTQSFWPISFANNSHQPIDAVTFGGSPLRPRRVVLACFDGFLREWTGTTDDGTNISGHVVLGPFLMSDSGSIEGMLAEVFSVIDEQSSPVEVEVYVGSSAEECSQAAVAGTSPSFSVEVNSGRSYTIRPRMRGVAFCLRLNATAPWSFESFICKVANQGRFRR